VSSTAIGLNEQVSYSSIQYNYRCVNLRTSQIRRFIENALLYEIFINESTERVPNFYRLHVRACYSGIDFIVPAKVLTVYRDSHDRYRQVGL